MRSGGTIAATSKTVKKGAKALIYTDNPNRQFEVLPRFADLPGVSGIIE
jgi:hypothetical protein